MTVHTYKGFKFSVRHYTHEELVKIDETLSGVGSGIGGNCGASTEPGFYHDDIENDETGEESGTPSGPYATEEGAKAAWIKVADRVI